MMSVVTTPLKKGFGRLAEKYRSVNIARAGKWTVYFVLIGVIAGLGSIVFQYLCELGVHYFLDLMAGYRFPNQRGSATIEVQNLLDEDFFYQDDGFREFGNEPSTGPYFPDFGVMARLTLNF